MGKEGSPRFAARAVDVSVFGCHGHRNHLLTGVQTSNPARDEHEERDVDFCAASKSR